MEVIEIKSQSTTVPCSPVQFPSVQTSASVDVDKAFQRPPLPPSFLFFFCELVCGTLWKLWHSCLSPLQSPSKSRPVHSSRRIDKPFQRLSSGCDRVDGWKTVEVVEITPQPTPAPFHPVYSSPILGVNKAL